MLERERQVIEKGKAQIDPEYMARFKGSRMGGMMGRSDGGGVTRKPVGPAAAGTTDTRGGLQPTRSELE